MDYGIIEEGKAKVKVSVGKVSSKLEVFYNPAMKLNRDISVAVLSALGRKKMQVALPLAGSGIRGIRFLKELPGSMVEKVYFNDLSETAYEAIKHNIKINHVKKTAVSNKDANLFLLEGKGFDYIDIDPFGSPVEFLDAAIRRLSRNGILAVTATDTGCLCGSFPSACIRKYGSRPLRNYLMHETGLRILIKKVQEAGAVYDKALEPVYSYATEHYMRVFFLCGKGKQKADAVAAMHGWLVFCNNCLEFTFAKDVFSQKKCSCGGMRDYAGRLWMGRLWDAKLAGSISCGKITELIKKESEIDAAGFYELHQLYRKHKIHGQSGINEIVAALHSYGHQASRTHFSNLGVRSSCTLGQIVSLLRALRQ